VNPVRRAALLPRARDVLMADLQIPVVSLEDVYGGKLVAAMDRQHPRDLFDVMQLFVNEGITPEIRRAFVVYLACHHRPVHEVLFPAQRDLAQAYEGTFRGMTMDPVALDSLLATRDRMTHELQSGLCANERRFLLGLVGNQPDWSLLAIPHAHQLPGIRWKLHNLGQLQKVNPKKFAEQAQALARLLPP
jgi:Nucleotidyl transferase AbiEii toxin, Type IV TA system